MIQLDDIETLYSTQWGRNESFYGDGRCLVLSRLRNVRVRYGELCCCVQNWYMSKGTYYNHQACHQIIQGSPPRPAKTRLQKGDFRWALRRRRRAHLVRAGRRRPSFPPKVVFVEREIVGESRSLERRQMLIRVTCSAARILPLLGKCEATLKHLAHHRTS